MPDNPLELFTIDDLATEIGRRAQSAIVVCTMPPREKDKLESRPETRLYQYGSLCENVGQCEYAKHELMCALTGGIEDIYQEEDEDHD